MAVANETIINKMMNELSQAKENQKNDEIMKKYIENVKLLCDLLLEEETGRNVNEKSESEAFSGEELKAMIGDQNIIKSIQDNQAKKSQTNNHEETNGGSIFDF